MRYFPNPYEDHDGNANFCVDSEKWLAKAREVASMILSQLHEVEENIDGGLYVGPAGVAYALWKMSSFLPPPEAEPMLAKAQHLVNLNLMYVNRQTNDKQIKYGFLLGTHTLLVC